MDDNVTHVAYDLSGKAAVVTGGSTGIGRAVGLALAAAGASVVIDHLGDHERAERTVREITNHGGSAIAVEADVSKPDAVKRLFAQAGAAFGGVDILINNASTEVNKFVWEMADEEWRFVIANSLDSVFYCSKYVLPYMIPRGGGKIINISSIHDTVPRKKGGPYCASKAGLLMLTEVLSLELVPHNVQVNAVSPGVVLTERTDPTPDRSPEFLAQGKLVHESNPYRRYGTVNEIVEPVLYFCSPNSNYTTGTTIYVDGAHRHNLMPIADGDARPFLKNLVGESE